MTIIVEYIDTGIYLRTKSGEWFMSAQSFLPADSGVMYK